MLIRICCISIILILCCTVAAVAAPITYTYTGTGTGTIGGTQFTSAAFTITGQADTANLASCGSGCQYINHLSTSIVIDGVGTYTISSPLRTFLAPGLVGLSRAGADGEDLYYIPGDFSGWGLVTNWGPVNTDSGSLLQWDHSPQIDTSGGVLVFQDEDQVSGSFLAVLKQENTSVPTMTEWGMIIFMVLAGLGAIYFILRQRKAES